MLRLRVLIVSLVCSGFVLLCEAEAQSPVPVSATPLALSLLRAIDDPNIVAELGLSEEQVKRLVACRQEVWDLQYSTPQANIQEAMANLGKKTEAVFRATLSEAQLKRATQIEAQKLIAAPRLIPRKGDSKLTYVIAADFAKHPELAAVFNLTEEQVKELKVLAGMRNTIPKKGSGIPRVAPNIDVTPEQTEFARKFLGPIFTKTSHSKSDPRQTRKVPQPEPLHLLTAIDVCDEVDLTEAQAAKLAEERKKWTALDKLEESLKARDEAASKLAAESEKVLNGALKPEQLSRLRQISRQMAGASTTIDFLYTSKEVVKLLEITDEQAKKLDGIWETYRDEVLKACKASENYATVEKRIQEIGSARQSRAAAVLTPAQTARLLGLVGTPFRGNTSPTPPMRGVGPAPLNNQRYNAQREAVFNKYDTEFVFLANNPSIQLDLKLSEEQIKKAREVRDNLQLQFQRIGAASPDYPRMFADRSKQIETELQKLLSPAQARRFRELMLQECKFREGRGEVNLIRVVSPVCYPGVAEAVKLTDPQMTRLFAGEPPLEVLTREQRKAILGALGEPFKGSFISTRSPREIATTPVQPLDPALVKLSNEGPKPLEEILKLTPEQLKALDVLYEAYRLDVFEYGRSMKAIDPFEKGLLTILDAGQKKRLAQLVVQLNAATNLSSTLLSQEMTSATGLDQKQIEKIKALERDAANLESLLATEIGQLAQELRLRIKEIQDERMLSVLTEMQRNTWKELTGESWKGIRKIAALRRTSGG